MEIDSYKFEKICIISPECGSNGLGKEFIPQGRYRNDKGLPLNKYGSGPFCKFKIPNNFNKSGVYAIVVEGVVKYIGECLNLSSRFNMGYGNISPRNCFVGGQETNCRINSLIYNHARQGKNIALWFFHTENYKSIEHELRESQELEWNRI